VSPHLLGLLEREPGHGYDIKRDYDTYFGRGRPLPYGQAYATLSRLARDGKAIAGPTGPGRPRCGCCWMRVCRTVRSAMHMSCTHRCATWS
jgi:Transcriptional regulator PadR-like family